MAPHLDPITALRGLARLSGLLIACTACSTTEPVGVRTIDTILVAPSQVSLVIGQSASLSASLRDEFGVAFAGVPVRWESSDEGVAVVSASGIVTALSTGTTSVLAVAEDHAGAAEITVTGFPMIQLTPASAAFTASSGANPAAQSVSITNSGDGTLGTIILGGITYGAGEPGGWLTLELSEDPLIVTLRVSAASLAVGSYVAEATVEGGDASNAPVLLPVSLQIVP